LPQELYRDDAHLVTSVGELALDEARHDDHFVLEALCLVDGHELHAVRLDVAGPVRLEIAARLLEEV